jgi:serine/threonine-protein kinase
LNVRSVLLASLMLPAAVHAQPSDPVLGEQLFEQGRALAKDNNWAAACPKFEASLRADPALGTRLNLATCDEKIGKLATAWGLYRESAEQATKTGDKKRHDYAVAQASALEKRLPRLELDAPKAMPDGLTITRDGTAIDLGALGTSLYVDPGPHEIVVAAPGYDSATLAVTSTEGKLDKLSLPELAKTKVITPPAPPHEDAPKPVIAVVPPPPPPATSHRKAIALGVAGGGVAIAAVGLVFGYQSRSSWNTAKDACGSDLVCDTDEQYAAGHKAAQDASSQATISTVLVTVGAAAVATGVVLWLTAPSAHRERVSVAPSIGAHGAGLVLGGHF